MRIMSCYCIVAVFACGSLSAGEANRDGSYGMPQINRMFNDARETNKCLLGILPYLNGLKIPLGSSEQLGSKYLNRLVSDHLKIIGDLNVRRQPPYLLRPLMQWDHTNGVGHAFELAGPTGKVVASVNIIYAPSVREMQESYFNVVSRANSLPDEAKIAMFRRKLGGSGDVFLEKLCVDSASRSLVTNKQVVTFLRRNLAVTVVAHDPAYEAEKIAQLLDDIVLRE